MRKVLTILALTSAFSNLLLFIRPRSQSGKTLLWIPKLIAGAFVTVSSFLSGIAAIFGLANCNWKLASTGVASASLAAKFLLDIPSADTQFRREFSSGWQEQIPGARKDLMLNRRISLLARAPQGARCECNVVIGQNRNKKLLLADLWHPPAGMPATGVGLIYAHGSGWRVGDKDMGTRTFFQRLASEGYVILDLAYTLWPEAGLQTMVSEFNQAILWMKANQNSLIIDPERIVLMGGSAGGHLALLAAYTPNHPAFMPADETGDTTVCGVVAFYPPVDLSKLQIETNLNSQSSPKLMDKLANGMLKKIFMIEEHFDPDADEQVELSDFLVEILGGNPDEIPEMYELLSPISHIGPQCPATLLLQGSDDLFNLAEPLREFYQKLQFVGVTSILVEYPHTEHAFDLVFPSISPVAQSATYEVERFLALIA